MMTPFDQTQQSEDANLRKVVAQLHVIIRATMLWPRAIRLSGGPDYADITGQSGLCLNMFDMASHYQVVFPVADKNPLTVFYGCLLGS